MAKLLTSPLTLSSTEVTWCQAAALVLYGIRAPIMDPFRAWKQPTERHKMPPNILHALMCVIMA